MGDKRTQREGPLGRRTRAPSNKGKQARKQAGTRGDRSFGKADTPSSEGKQEGRQSDTGGRGETRLSETQTHHLTKGREEGYNGRQKDTKGGKTFRKADTPSNKKEARKETMGDKTLGLREDGQATSNRRKQEGRQWGTKPSEIQRGSSKNTVLERDGCMDARTNANVHCYHNCCGLTGNGWHSGCCCRFCCYRHWGYHRCCIKGRSCGCSGMKLLNARCSS